MKMALLTAKMEPQSRGLVPEVRDPHLVMLITKNGALEQVFLFAFEWLIPW